jgi:ferredoxin-NADP reductase
MEEHNVRILGSKWLTHDVKQFTVEKPAGYSFVPGQATELAIDEEGWKSKKRPFTFTSLNSWPHLEFIIKIYNDHDGVTKHLGTLQEGDRLLIHDVWGAINYQGPGVFIAAGAGITPFISIFRHLEEEKKSDRNTLIYSNKTKSDVILEETLGRWTGLRVYHNLTRENAEGYHSGRINGGYLEKILPAGTNKYYVCGPEQFTADILKMLESRGADASALVFEK